MAKNITLKAAETAYLKQQEKVEKLKADLETAEKDLKSKRDVFTKLKKQEALDTISKALFSGNQDVSDDDITEIVEFINMQSEDKAKKVVTNDNFSENEEIKNEAPTNKAEH